MIIIEKEKQYCIYCLLALENESSSHKECRIEMEGAEVLKIGCQHNMYSYMGRYVTKYCRSCEELIPLDLYNPNEYNYSQFSNLFGHEGQTNVHEIFENISEHFSNAQMFLVNEDKIVILFNEEQEELRPEQSDYPILRGLFYENTNQNITAYYLTKGELWDYFAENQYLIADYDAAMGEINELCQILYPITGRYPQIPELME